MDNKGFRIKKSINTGGFLTNYEFSYKAIEGDNTTIWNVTRNGELANSD